MNPNSQNLLDELGLNGDTKGTTKKEKAPATAPATKKAHIQNADADELLSELNIDKKKSSLPVSSGGQSAPSASSVPPSESSAPAPDHADLLKEAGDFIRQDYSLNRQNIDPALAQAGYGRQEKYNGPLVTTGNSQPLPYPYGPKEQQKPFPAPGTPEWKQMQDDQMNQHLGDIFRADELKKQPLPPTDTRFLKAIDEGDSRALSTYYKTRVAQVDQDFKAKQLEIEKKYPAQSIGKELTHEYRSADQQKKYDEEMSKLKNDTEALRNKLSSSVDLLLDKKIVSEIKKQATPQDQENGRYFDTEKIGKQKMKLMDDPDIDKWERYESKGLPVPDGVKYQMDKIGLATAQSAIMQEIKERGTYNDQGELVSIPEDLKKSISNVDKLSGELWNKHAPYRKDQVARAISDKIYKDKNWFQTLTGAYRIGQDDINRAAEELGFPQNLVKDVKPGDIKTANMFGTFVNDLAMKPGAGAGAFITRNVRKMMGQDPDYVDARTDYMKQKWSTMLADTPDAGNLFGQDYTVDVNKNSSTFLENVNNPQKGKFNWGATAIGNTIASGFGQLLNYAEGGNLLGAGIKGVNLLQKGNQARNAGLVTYAFLTQYDDNYNEAKQMGIKNEAAANGFAAIRSLASGFTEMIFPDYKVTDALFGPKSAATKVLLDRIKKKGIEGLTEASVRPILRRAFTEGLKDTGKESFEEIADQMADVVTTAMFKPDALKDRNVPRELWETAVTTAIGTILPVTAGAYNEQRHQSSMTKSLIYQVGVNPSEYITSIQDLADQGKIKQEDADRRIKVINTLNNIVSTVPQISSETGRPLTETDKVNYTNNLLQEKLLTEQLEKVKGDKVQEKNINAKIVDLQNERQMIINHADGVEVNSEGEPLMKGDDRVIITPENKDTVLEMDEKLKEAETQQEKDAITKEYKEKLAELEKSSPNTQADATEQPDSSRDQETGTSSDQPGKKEGKEEGRKNVLKDSAPSEDSGEELDLLPTKQREKVKAGKNTEDAQVVQSRKLLDENPDGLKGTFKEMAKQDPVGTVKMIAEQAQGVLGDGSSIDNPADQIAVREKAEKLYGKGLVNEAINMFPAPKAEAKKPSLQPAGEKADVFYAPTDGISTDVERFQPRGTDYSKESVSKIVSSFDDNKLDPVVLYRDKNGKDYVLAGHSRLEAHNRLEELPDSDAQKKAAIEKGYQPGKIKARYFKGTEAEAKEFADRSNDLGTKNKDYESANSLRKMREAGKTKKDITDRAKTDFGKNWRYINNLSYLNPNGKILTTLQQFAENPDKEAQNKIEKAAQWVGAVRERLGDQLSNAHENEMFDFLMDKSRSTKLDRENDFIALVQNITGRFDFDRGQPLNLARIKNKSAGEIAHDQEEREIKQAIKDKEDEQHNLSERLNNPKNPAYVNPNSPDYADVLRRAEAKKQAINQELTALRKELLQHQQDKGKVVADQMNQFGLFDLNSLSPSETKALNEELKPDGITTDNIKDYEESISDSEQVPQESGRDAGKAGPVQENVQRPLNDEGAGSQQNTAGTKREADDSEQPVELTREQEIEGVRKLFTVGSKFTIDGQPVSVVKYNNGIKVVDSNGDLVKGILLADFQLNNPDILYKYGYLLYENGLDKPAPAKTGLDKKVDAATEKKNAALQKFADKLKQARGRLNMGLDPEVIAAGVELMAAYVEEGTYKFAQIIRNAIQQLGGDFFDKENTDGFKMAYAAYRSQQSREDRKNLDSDDDVDDFIENELPNILADETTAEQEDVPEEKQPEPPANISKDENLYELDTRNADSLSEKYKGTYVRDPQSPMMKGVLDRIGYIQGGRKFHVYLTNGASFTISPEQLQSVLENATPPTKKEIKEQETQFFTMTNAVMDSIQSKEGLFNDDRFSDLKKQALDLIDEGKEYARRIEMIPDSLLDRAMKIAVDVDDTAGKKGKKEISQAQRTDTLNRLQEAIDRNQKLGRQEVVDKLQAKYDAINSGAPFTESDVSADLIKDAGGLIAGFQSGVGRDPLNRPKRNPLVDVVDQVAKKYGWRAIRDGSGYELVNRKNNVVATVEVSGSKYVIRDSGGEKILSGNKSLPGAVESIIKDHFYGKPITPEEVAAREKVDNTIYGITQTDPGSEDELKAATEASKALFEYKQLRGETNQIDRQAVENIRQFLKGRVFGFNQYTENSPGWFTNDLPWQNEETLSADPKKNLPVASIDVAMGPNGLWTNGVSVHLPSGSGYGSGVSVNGDAFPSRQAAINDAIEQAYSRLEGMQRTTKADQTEYNKFVKWANSLTQSQSPNLFNDAPGTANNLESNSPRTTARNPVRKGIVSPKQRANDEQPSPDGSDVIEEGLQPQGSPSLFPFDAPTQGTPSDKQLPDGSQQSGLEELPSQPGELDRSGSTDADRALAELETVPPVTGTSRQFTSASIEDKIKAQKAAEGIPVIPMDIQNIRATLPFLMKEQQEDVLAAENRFFGPQSQSEDDLYGKAIMFTNGTGTGKTLSGLGIAKRFIKQGKVNGLIVVPSATKASDWVEEATDYMQIPLRQLTDTKDAGDGGPVVTTYANFRDNFNLQQRTFDWVIYDEAHKINSNNAGTNTSAEAVHKSVTKSPYAARMQAMKNINYDQRMTEIRRKEMADNPNRENVKDLDEELYQETVKVFKKTKVIFLSATPFSYHKNLEYADGFLYKITSDFRPTYDSDSYRQFYISNFGYRIRYNKLTAPEAGVDVDLLERQFTEGLKKKGVIVARKLNLDHDYSRQFVVVEDGVGNIIDEGLDVVNDRELFPTLSKYASKQWTYLYKNRLMEALKARAYVDKIKKHLELNRKIVVFHSYNEGTPRHPFDFNNGDFLIHVPPEELPAIRDDISNFEQQYPQYAGLDLSYLVNPIATLSAAFPDKVEIFNGTRSKKDRDAAIKNFNRDGSGKDIIIVQADAGQEGISLHDRTGKHQRVMVNLGLPVKPTTAIQTEGRVYRTGQKSNAVIEYPVMQLNFERFAYGSKIKDRVRTAENFALGDEARNMEIAFKEGYMNASDIEPSVDQGVGGKQEDSRLDSTTEFQKAKTYYWKRQKRNSRDKKFVSGDYYATPEPLGMKMAEWMDLAPNEKALEPSAGHGAIGRFFPGDTNNHFIEPNSNLRSELALNAPGEVKAGTFEDLNIINKYDGIAMNPPFGTQSKTAMDHLKKALGHLREGGRVVALVPVGQMDKRLDQWLESEESDGYHIRVKMLLPSVTFERAATSVNTQILVIDKISDEEKAQKAGYTRNYDLRSAENVNELFDRIEDMEMPSRVEKGVHAAPPGATEEELNEGRTSAGIPTGQAASQAAPSEVSEVVKAFHAKQQKDIWVVKLNKRVSGDEFNQLREVAKQLEGYYSMYKGQGAIPGFVFPTEESANKMQAAITGQAVPEGDKLSLADRIRAWKLGRANGSLNSFIIPVPALWNAAVELVAKAVEAGEALADALRKGLDHIDQNYKERWRKSQYNQEMMKELKAKGVFSYSLTSEQKAQAEKILRRVIKGGSLVKEVIKVREVYDDAISKLKDPNDIAELEASYNELENYLFSSLAAREAEKGEHVDLELGQQTWWQKQKENIQNMHERLGTVQKAITDAGLTIDEKNDMVNSADRWKSVAQAKINEILHKVGLADVDVFVWKGTKKVDDSMFDRMAKEGVDWRQFNLYMYAQHAPERNAHNAKIRRQNLAERIMELEGEIASKQADQLIMPSSVLKGQITRLENEHELLSEYEKQYSDPNANQNYVRLLESKISKRLHLMDDGGSGMTNQQAQEIIDEVTKNKLLDKFEKFEDEFRSNIIDKLLDLKREYGLVDQENYDYMTGYYKNYVPLKVDQEYFDKELTFAQQKLPGSKIFASKGANYINFEKRVNPVTQSVIDLQATIYEGENNRFKQTVANAVRTAPDSKVWELQSAQYSPIKDKYGKVLALKEVNQPRAGIPFMQDGIKKYLVVHDSALNKALTGENVKKAIPAFATVNNFFRQLFTVYNPAFTVTNLFRDLQTAGAILNSNYGPEVAKHFRANAAQIHKIIAGSYKEQMGNISGYWAQRAKEYEELGGQMSWFRPEVATEQVKDIEETYQKYQKDNNFETGKQLALKLADFFNRGNQAVENSTRLAIFDAMMKAGTPAYKAVEVARNATINFNKKGNYTGTVDSLYLFFNAGIQGSANLLYSLLASKRGKFVAGGIAMLGLIQSMWNGMVSDCSDPTHPEDCYDNVQDYEKERNMVIKIPGTHGFLKIPLAYGFNVFWNAGEQIGQGIRGKTGLGKASTFLLKTALNSFNPLGGSETPLLQQLSPTATDPIVQWYTNKDAFGRPIYSDVRFDHRPDSEKALPSDSPFSQRMTRWLNSISGGNNRLSGAIDIAPGTVDHIFETLTGGTGQFLKQAEQTTEEAIDPNRAVLAVTCRL
jgi:hypothetical protein